MGMYDRQHEWLSTQAADLAGYVLELCHDDLAYKLPGVGALLAVALAEQGEEQPLLYELGRAVSECRRLLVAHYTGLEADLLRDLRRAADAPADAHTDGEPRLLERWQKSVEEHRALEDALSSIRRVCFDYSVPPEAAGRIVSESADIHGLYDRLRDLEIDVRRHIYIEEQLLIPLLAKQADS